MKKILALAFPLIISQLISMALVLTDVWMMSRLSVSALAGGGLGASIYFFIFIIASSTVGCVANLIAIAYGQRLARPDYGNQQIRFAVRRCRFTLCGAQCAINVLFFIRAIGIKSGKST